MSTTPRGRLASVLGGIDRSIAVLALLSFISQLGVAIMLPLLPLYAVELGATPSQLGLMVGAFSVTATVGQLSAGFLAKWLSPRRQMPLGQAIYATGNILIATTTSAVPLIVFRAASGLGGGLTLISERLYIARVTAQDRLAFVNGVVSAAGSSGAVVGPLFGALLAVQDLRMPFVVVAVTATIAGIAALLYLPGEQAAERGSGSAPPEDGHASDVAPAPVASSVHAPDAPDAPDALGRWARIKPLARLALWSVAFNAAYGGWITTFAPYSTQVLGFGPELVALFFIPFGLGSIIIGPVLARFADRTGRRRMVAIGTALVLVNIVSLVVAAPILVIYGTAILAGGGFSAAQASWFALLGVATDGGRRGRSFGFTSALSNLGVIAGAGAASIAWERLGLGQGVMVAGAFLVLAAASLVVVPDDRRRP